MTVKSRRVGTRGPVARQNRLCYSTRFGQQQIRIYHRAGKGKKMPRYLLKCGCCPCKLEIYYDRDGLEIGGVNGALRDWREILTPLLYPARSGRGTPRRPSL